MNHPLGLDTGLSRSPQLASPGVLFDAARGEKGKDVERNLTSDVAEINALWDEYAAAATAGNMERWIALWNEGGIQMPPGAMKRAGKALIHSEMQPLFDLFDMQVAIYPDEIQVLGDQAFSHGSYEFAMTPKEGGDRIGIKGKFLTVLQKQANGSWKIAIDCFNYDTPCSRGF